MSTYLAGFVEAVGRELDITRDQFEQARAQYLAIGDWISQRYEGHADVEIYSQGSFRLGTVVRPVVDRGDFDIDLVFLRQLQPGSISQQKLRDEAGELLSAYCEAHDLDEPLELGRCWRLDFFDAGFHLDVLPAIPHEDSATAIRLSDRDLHEWQYSNPIGYANWFSQRQNSALVDESRRSWRRLSTSTSPKCLTSSSGPHCNALFKCSSEVVTSTSKTMRRHRHRSLSRPSPRSPIGDSLT